MASTKPRYPMEEIGRRGDALYKSHVLPHLKAKDKGKFVAVDIESGAYAIDVDELGACHRLRARLPDAQIRLVRIGSRTVYQFGGSDLQGPCLSGRQSHDQATFLASRPSACADPPGIAGYCNLAPMSNPLVNRWRQRGKIYLWRFDDEVRKYPGWNFTADDDGCTSLLQLFDTMVNDERSASVEIALSKPSADIQALGPGIGKGRLRAPQHVALQFPPMKVAANFWQWTGTLHDPQLKVGQRKLVELIGAVQSVAEGVGDFCIGADDHREHGLEFANMSIWFW